MFLPIFFLSVDLELDFYGIAVSNPVDLMKKWLEVSPSISTSAVSGEERRFTLQSLLSVYEIECFINMQFYTNKKSSCDEAS